MNKVIKLITKTKSKICLNGDWLFVTESPVGKTKDSDISLGYRNNEINYKKIKILDQKKLEVMHHDAKEFYNNTIDRMNVTRDKAKVFLSASSFVSAVIMGIFGQLATLKEQMPNWLIIIISVFFLLSTIHLIRSLYLTAKSITREQFIAIPPSSIIVEDSRGYLTSKYYKEMIANYIAYAIQTQDYIRNRNNSIILGQHSFLYGLFYFSISVFGLILSLHFKNNVQKSNIFESCYLTEALSDLEHTQQSKKLKKNKIVRKEIHCYRPNNKG
ncbi:hypothetical protein [Leptospira sanjuanensis]|uniref:hypothetical protein n=1 Tax=Leptospira sanjuanensis TaxID=2879643 RepID=UPI001EE8789D|nr:hypothetical protein [Leptospira sanjuanensis]MCG6170205.1 hypothetical protein [Leptospira sanjuanensis]